MVPALAYPLREKFFGDKSLSSLESDPMLRLSHELHHHLRLHGASRYADLPSCKILDQDTPLWLDMHLCSANRESILGELLLQDFYRVAIRRVEGHILTIYRRPKDLPSPSS